MGGAIFFKILKLFSCFDDIEILREKKNLKFFLAEGFFWGEAYFFENFKFFLSCFDEIEIEKK